MAGVMSGDSMLDQLERLDPAPRPQKAITPARVFTVQLLGEGAPQEVTAFNVQFKDGWVLFFYDQHDEELVLAFPTARVVYVEGGGLA